MRILLSNDDGCMAPGLRCLERHLRPLHEITLCAPDRNRSGASNSLTLMNPIRVHTHEDGALCVDGTPTDCVHLAVTGLMKELPEMVVSGINAGSNLGDDTLYSGTVAAAMEGRHLGFAAIAVSCCSPDPQHYDTAARITVQLVERLRREPLPADTILNVNVPDIPFEALQGIEVTRLGNRHLSRPAVPGVDPRGRPLWWLGPAGNEQDAGPGTDFYAVMNHRVSVTPLLVDLTRYSAMEQLAEWIRAL